MMIRFKLTWKEWNIIRRSWVRCDYYTEYICYTVYILYSIYAIHSICYTVYMLYTVYAIHSIL